MHPFLKKKYGYNIPDFIGNQPFSDFQKYAQANYSGFNRIKFYFKIFRGYLLAYLRLFFTLLLKRCYYGPFKGEFGNFLGHNLPFLAYLHSKGVKIYYCGMALHKPFLMDEKRQPLIYKFLELRDFFKEVTPDTNCTIPPADVQKLIEEFESEARNSIYPYFLVGDPYYYWFIHRTWMLRGPFMKTIPYEKIYKTANENAVVIFPRNRGSQPTPNNGELWNFNEVADVVKPFFDKVYIVGHPAFSSEMLSRDNIEVVITNDNSKIIEKCCNSQLIISQHSGTFYLGEYTDTQMLIIFKGEFPISTVNDSLIFNSYLGTKRDIDFAFSLEEIAAYAKSFVSNLKK